MVFDAFADSKPAAKTGTEETSVAQPLTNQSVWAQPARDEWRERQDAAFKQKLDAALSPDRHQRTDESMKETVENLIELGEDDPGRLYKETMKAHLDARSARLQSNPSEELRMARTGIAGVTAISALTMEHSFGSSDLSDKNLDLGGNALFQLLLARAGVDRTSQLVEELNGKVIDGKPVDAKERLDLEKIGARVDSKIAAIEGPHDVVKVKDELKEFLRPSFIFPLPVLDQRARDRHRISLHAAQANTFDRNFLEQPEARIYSQIRMAEAAGNKIDENPLSRRVIAKMLRDQALASIAKAELNMEEGKNLAASDIVFGRSQDRRYYSDLAMSPDLALSLAKGGIAGKLEAAQKLGPDNLDLPKLKKMSDDLAAKMNTLGYPQKPGKSYDPFALPEKK